VVKFDGFLTLYQEARTTSAEDEDSRNRLPPMSAGRSAEAARDRRRPAFHRAAAALFGSLAGQAHGRARHRPALDLRLDPAGAADRGYVRIDKKRLHAEDKGRVVTAFLENFFARYVEYDFTAGLEEQLDRISNNEIDWRDVLRDFWRDFIGAVGDIKDLRVTEVLDALDEMLGRTSSRRAPTAPIRASARTAAPASSRSSSASSAPSSAARTIRNAASPASSPPAATAAMAAACEARRGSRRPASK
jgi:DNA topoisomerase-1